VTADQTLAAIHATLQEILELLKAVHPQAAKRLGNPWEGEQLAKLQTTAERRGVEVSTLVRELALRQLQSSPITPAEAEAAIADAYETAALEVLPQYENADAPLEDQLAALSQTEADLRARKSRLQGQKSELARQRAEALRAGDADRAAGLGREIGDLENEINTITETLEALGQTRLELWR